MGAVLAFLAYLLFFVQLGERSAFQHLMRLIKTEEAQELGREVGAATERLTERIGNQVHEATKPPAEDAGTSKVPGSVSDPLGKIVEPSYERERRINAASQRESQ